MDNPKTKTKRFRLCLTITAALSSLAFVLLAYLGNGVLNWQTPSWRTTQTTIPPMEEFNISSSQELREIGQIVFAKVHKAASSTVQNILLRFALARKLSVLLPIKTHVINEHGYFIDRKKMLPNPEGKEKFDVLCNHVVYKKSEIAKFIPGNATRVTILREPMKQAISALVYYTTNYRFSQLKKGLKKHPVDPINGFLRRPWDFYHRRKKHGPLSSYINNRMSLDLGLETIVHLEAAKKNKSKIEEFVNYVDREFDLVLISEYFDESMVLLRRRMRWSLRDVIYLKRNSAKQLPESSPFHHKPLITPKVVQRFRQWAVIDYTLYEHFLFKFQKIIAAESYFQDEVKTFKKILADVRQFCLEDKTSHSLDIEGNAWTENLRILKFHCKLMATEGIVDIVKKKQKQRYYKNLKGQITRLTNNSI